MFSWVTVLILFIFQPFGTFESQLSYKYLRLAGYGVATFLAIFLAGMIEIELSKHQKSIPRYPIVIVALYVSISALFNHSYFVVAIFGHWQWQNQMMFVLYVVAISIFPALIIYFRNSKTDEIVNTVESKNSVNDQEPDKFQIVGENKSDVLTAAFSDIILMKSADNYCEIITHSDNETTVHLMRISLSKALAQLPESPTIVRCHRSFGVNLSFVKSCQGNANGLKLEMEFSDIVVPVSRTYADDIKQALSFLPKSS